MSNLALTVLIVDDEELGRAIVKECISRRNESISIIECDNGFEAIKLISQNKFDAVFLDVQMPRLSGLEVADAVAGEVPIIFVTAFDTYAVRAFELSAVDYVLKPFTFDRLNAALDRAISIKLNPKTATINYSELRKNAENKEYLTKIIIRDRDHIYKIPVEDIIYIQAQDSYILIKTKIKEFLKLQRISEIEKLLNPAQFIRIHRSYIIPVGRLVSMKKNESESWKAVLNSGDIIPISKTRYKALLGYLE
ncbi:LytR/AlgR family response regulator transcription factor [Geothrix terrae]|uniref:LytR/AlgR family response regulator transcription factor n=1 Tax=Geothrix terrae TaxID=2922720 RepID=UPI001FAB5EB5|nr:LytTR family DNA-binding domain-containing protein [Geothrix terrae]